MDLAAAKQLRKQIDVAVTSGEDGVPSSCLAAIKALVRAEPVLAPKVALETLLLHLKAAHAQERMGALVIADVLFTRSHAFRVAFLQHIDDVLVYATGHSAEHPLPPPAKYARRLRQEFWRMLTRWHEKFGSKHKPLALAFGFLSAKMGSAGLPPRQDSEEDLQRVMQFRKHERGAQARKAFALFQQALPKVRERLQRADLVLRNLVAFPGEDGFLDGVACGSSRSEKEQDLHSEIEKELLQMSETSSSTRLPAGHDLDAEDASTCGDISFFRSVFGASDSEGGEEHVEGRVAGRGAHDKVEQCDEEERNRTGHMDRGVRALEPAALLGELGLAGTQYVLDVSVGGRALRDRVAKRARQEGLAAADGHSVEPRVQELRGLCRQIELRDRPQLEAWGESAAAVEARAEFSGEEARVFESLLSVLRQCDKVLAKCAGLGVCNEGEVDDSDGDMEDVDVFGVAQTSKVETAAGRDTGDSGKSETNVRTGEQDAGCREEGMTGVLGLSSSRIDHIKAAGDRRQGGKRKKRREALEVSACHHPSRILYAGVLSVVTVGCRHGVPTDRAVAQAIADAPAKRVLAKGRRVLRPEAGLSQHYKTAIQMSGGLRD